MPLASDIKAPWSVELASERGQLGWDPSLGPDNRDGVRAGVECRRREDTTGQYGPRTSARSSRFNGLLRDADERRKRSMVGSVYRTARPEILAQRRRKQTDRRTIGHRNKRQDAGGGELREILDPPRLANVGGKTIQLHGRDVDADRLWAGERQLAHAAMNKIMVAQRAQTNCARSNSPHSHHGLLIATRAQKELIPVDPAQPYDEWPTTLAAPHSHRQHLAWVGSSGTNRLSGSLTDEVMVNTLADSQSTAHPSVLGYGQGLGLGGIADPWLGTGSGLYSTSMLPSEQPSGVTYQSQSIPSTCGCSADESTNLAIKPGLMGPGAGLDGEAVSRRLEVQQYEISLLRAEVSELQAVLAYQRYGMH